MLVSSTWGDADQAHQNYALLEVSLLLSFMCSADIKMEEPQSHLPEACVRLIAQALTRNESPGNSVLHLLCMAGVCSQWRGIAQEAPETISFEGLDTPALGGQATLYKFRKLSTPHKQRVFEAAARLFVGAAACLHYPVCMAWRGTGSLAARTRQRAWPQGSLFMRASCLRRGKAR